MACRRPGFVTGGSVPRHGAVDHGPGWDGWMDGWMDGCCACVGRVETDLTASLFYSQISAGTWMDCWILLRCYYYCRLHPGTCLSVRAIQPLDLWTRREISDACVLLLHSPDFKHTICTHTCSYMTGLDRGFPHSASNLPKEKTARLTV